MKCADAVLEPRGLWTTSESSAPDEGGLAPQQQRRHDEPRDRDDGERSPRRAGRPPAAARTSTAAPPSRRRSWPRPRACRRCSRWPEPSPRAERQPVAHERGLCRLACEEPQRREVADRVAGDDRGERRGKGQRVGRFETETSTPAARITNRRPPRAMMAKSPSRPAPTPLQISGRSDLADVPGEEHQPEDGGDDAGEIRASWTGIGGSGRRRPVEWHAVII